MYCVSTHIRFNLKEAVNPNFGKRLIKNKVMERQEIIYMKWSRSETSSRLLSTPVLRTQQHSIISNTYRILSQKADEGSEITLDLTFLLKFNWKSYESEDNVKEQCRESSLSYSRIPRPHPLVKHPSLWWSEVLCGQGNRDLISIRY